MDGFVEILGFNDNVVHPVTDGFAVTLGAEDTDGFVKMLSLVNTVGHPVTDGVAEVEDAADME